ncbi:hypothetical protein CBM2637_A200165 [Cupriavidus taiwanensis]|nr:hypothetical protein CBM2637_A200165 [Cupriavidus taiwanensis]
MRRFSPSIICLINDTLNFLKWALEEKP